jgi:hypothetical protein
MSDHASCSLFSSDISGIFHRNASAALRSAQVRGLSQQEFGYRPANLEHLVVASANFHVI